MIPRSRAPGIRRRTPEHRYSRKNQTSLFWRTLRIPDRYRYGSAEDRPALLYRQADQHRSELRAVQRVVFREQLYLRYSRKNQTSLFWRTLRIPDRYRYGSAVRNGCGSSQFKQWHYYEKNITGSGCGCGALHFFYRGRGRKRLFLWGSIIGIIAHKNTCCFT
jgi:hypothetical protein